MGLEHCPECGAATHVYSDAGNRQHEQGCSLNVLCAKCKGRGGWCNHGGPYMQAYHIVSCGTWNVCPDCKGTGFFTSYADKVLQSFDLTPEDEEKIADLLNKDGPDG
jgi:hypothetical protein